MKTHNNYNCGQCEKSFKNVELLNKHSKITHENLKIYCHYYNNSKTCPFKEECLFLHVEAPICKYGKLCERMLCMFKHVPETDEEHGDVELTTTSINILGDVRASDGETKDRGDVVL